MRRYTPDSPQAAARVLALALIADGQLSRTEIDLLDRIQAHDQLGLARGEMHQVLSDLLQDLDHATQVSWNEADVPDTMSLHRLLAEVQDPKLREKLLWLCVAAAEADGHVTRGEHALLANAAEQWGLQRRLFDRSAQRAAA